jgi:hypothetical protein
MSMLSRPEIEGLPAIIFQFSSDRLELLHKEATGYPGLTPAKLSKILRSEWRRLVPEEFHAVVRKLGTLSESESDTTVEFPVYWMGNTVWLRIIAAAVPAKKGKRKIIGLAQDVTSQRQSAPEADLASEEAPEKADNAWRKLRHDINGSLTSVLMNCELLLESGCSPIPRRRIEAIFSEALQIEQLLQHYRKS